MDHSLIMLLERLQTTTSVSQVTFTRDELNILVRALSAYTATPAASLIITTRDSGAVSHAINYGWSEEEKQQTEQQGGQYIPLFRHDISG
ncbi:hypothetical protein PN925_000052 [Morganella morganii]|uniref:Uncharacterized protein n=1 Tax=Morganella morganii TaxID=582 RepID=A0AAI9HMZ1_MORMO|nr:hypothetical protein [Morganella morganii]HCE8948651.1 hypothetical protein [Morganella morganii]